MTIPRPAIHHGTVPRDRLASARLASHAEGPTLLLGSPIEGLVPALWERAPTLWHGVADPLHRQRLVREATDLSVPHYVVFGPEAKIPGGFATVIWDVDGLWGHREPGEVLALSEGIVLVTGRSGRAAHVPRGRHPFPQALGNVLADLSPDARMLPAPDRGRFLIAVGAPPSGEAESADEGDDAGPAAAERNVEPYAIDAGPSVCPVTAIIPSAGRSPWLRESIESVLEQTMPPERLLVVSDGGERSVRSTVSDFGERIDLVEIPRGGQAAAMNAALTQVATPYVAWLDDDDRWLPRKLEIQWRDLENHPDAAFGTTDHYAIDASGNLIDWRPMVSFDPEQVHRLLLGGSFFLGPTVMVRHEYYRDMGAAPYDTSLTRAQDYAMWFELADRGGVRVLPLALTEVRRHPGNQLTPERVTHVRDAARHTLRDARDRWELQRFFPGIADASAPDDERETRVTALLERAGHLVRVGLVEEALDDLRTALTLNPDDARVRHFHAITLLESGDVDRAEQAFRDAQRVGAPPAEVACGLGTIAWWRGDRDTARRYYQQAVSADPRFPVARWNLALIEAREGSPPSAALELARRLLAQGPPHGYLLTPTPPLEGMEAELVRLRREERGWPSFD